MSMSGYTKLFNSILASTIWRENDKTRLVWITLLAMSDKDGICEGSVPGLADFARVTVDECEAALEVLSSPDKYSRTIEHEGRRIEALDGTGWRLLNHAKYRAKMSEDERREYNRQKQAEHRAKLKAETVNDGQTLSNGVNDRQSQSAESAQEDTDTEANTKEEKKQKDVKSVAKPTSGLAEEIFEFWQTVHGHPMAHFTKERKDAVNARLKAGYTIAEIQQAILGCKVSPKHQGQNESGKIYDDLELICRNDTHLERFMGYKRTPEVNQHGKPKSEREKSADRGTNAVNMVAELRRLGEIQKREREELGVSSGNSRDSPPFALVGEPAEPH